MNRQLPAIGGVAMILIVLNHTVEMGKTVPLAYGYPPVEGATRVLLTMIQGLGIFGVPTFLFISGAFVSYAARGASQRLNFKFLAHRLKYLIWPYLIWSCAFYVVVFFHLGERYSPTDYVKKLVVGYPFHFIPLLLFFYLLSPLLVRVAQHHSQLLLAVVGFYQILLLALVTSTSLQATWGLLIPPVIGRTLADWAIYFPLGLVCGLRNVTIVPRLKQGAVFLAVSTIVLFSLGELHYQRVLYLPVVANLAPLAFVLLIPAIGRQTIPWVTLLEAIGKRSYGLYLTNLITLDLALLALGTLFPFAFRYRLALFPFLFAVALTFPMLCMSTLARSPARPAYRYLFG